ncbi:MAG: GNAT family N-acetyltransferase [Betaproteobacteria bacterium]|nr:GNAT family N-acetyltransferase [Betaproteobacteria bacterium]
MSTLQHYLRPLLAPASVALVGASDKPGTLGRIVYENLLEGGYKGELYAVNPSHRRLLGKRCHASLPAIGKPVELALIAVPCAAVTDVLDDGARAGVKAAVILSAPPLDDGDARRWQRDLVATAKKRRIRLLGPHAFGVVRTELGLNATMGAGVALPGRLALIAQSGAVCTAMLNFARPNGIGFSTVAAIGGAYDIGFGELLDALVNDPQTDGILLYVEKVSDARRFLSALRAAARTKPVVVLRAGRSSELHLASAGSEAPLPDAVFDAAMKRAGTVRVMSYAQLFAAARILSMGKQPRGDRLAIVTNGHGPGTLAADSAADRGVPLAELSPETDKALAAVLPPNVASRNPINVRGDATPERMAAAVSALLADPQVDAVLALHVQRPATGATDAARAVATVARSATKPVLAAWLGAIGQREVRDALEAGGVPDFYTPEHAVEAFSFVAAYRRNQQWLLEVPAPQPEPESPDTTLAERLRDEAGAANHTVLTDWQTQQLLRAFDLPVEEAEPADTLKETLAAARRLGYPVTLKLDISGLHPRSPVPPDALVRANLRSGRMLTKAYGNLLEDIQPHFRIGDFNAHALVYKTRPMPDVREVAIGVHTDAVFGPVITFGNSGTAALIDSERTVLLPPLNHRLATDLISGSRAAASLRPSHDAIPDLEPLVRILLQVSSLVCALPWVNSMSLDPVRVGVGGAVIAGARVSIDPKRKFATGGYRHMAIHPYPIELVADVPLRDGTVLHVRPIMPEDAELERAFVHGLSEQTRYFRFFYRLHELTPAMLARFTQVDYDRELALVAISDNAGTPAFVGVARYIGNPDQESAEFAVVVADAWQNRGVARMLMERLIDCARKRGLKRLEGAVLRNNSNMIRFTEGLGFVTHDDPDEPEQVNSVLELVPEAALSARAGAR